MSDITDKLANLLDPVPPTIAKIFPGAVVVPMTKEEIKKLAVKNKKKDNQS